MVETGKKMVSVIGTLALIALFGVAVTGKLLEPDTSLEFLRAITGSTEEWVEIYLISLIVFEAFLALALILFNNRKWSYYLAGGTLLIMMAVVGYGMYLDLEALCGCFGSVIEATTVNANALVRNGLFAILALLIPNLD